MFNCLFNINTFYENYCYALILAVVCVLLILFFIIMLFFAKKIVKEIKLIIDTKKTNIKFNKIGGRKIRNDNYYRDIPCDNDFLKAYYILYNFNSIVPIYDLRKNVIYAFLLKWIHQEYVEVIKNDNRTEIKFNKDTIKENSDEDTLYSLLKELIEIHNYNKKTKLLNPNYYFYKRINDFFETVLESQREYFIKNEYIEKTTKRFLAWDIGEELFATEKMKAEAEKLLGLKNFFEDFSSLSEKEIAEVKTWDKYLQFAYLLGVGKKFLNNLDLKNLNSMGISSDSFDYLDSIFSNSKSRGGHNSNSDGGESSKNSFR